MTGTGCREIEHRYPQHRLQNEKRRLGQTEAALLSTVDSGRERCAVVVISGDEAEAHRIHGAGLAGHGVGKALALESGRQVHFAAGEKAGKKLHHHLLSVAQTGRLRLMEWGSSFCWR
jgi:hypothetical protein